jgi:GNAT superfamily N-acetyltransferase
VDVRKANDLDIETCVGLAERSRRQLQKYQPLFWRKASNSVEASRTLLGSALAAPDAYFLVAVEASRTLGFLVARKMVIAPVYAPGGDTWLVDDFYVAEARQWLSVGEALLSHVSTLVHEHGAAQIVVTCADRDLAKTEMLRRADLAIASSWWTKPLR